jgi:hypothetical protein
VNIGLKKVTYAITNIGYNGTMAMLKFQHLLTNIVAIGGMQNNIV